MLLDIVMAGIDGYEVCRRVRADPRTAYLPVVMITASGEQEKLQRDRGRRRRLRREALPPGRARRTGGVAGPGEAVPGHDRAAGRASSRSGTASSRRASARRWTSCSGSSGSVVSCRRSSRTSCIDSGDESLLDSHRREIVVVFCDLRGFTPFAEQSEPEEVMEVLGEYHRALGELIVEYEGTLERFTGDGSWSSSTTRSPATTRPGGRSRWRWRCATASPRLAQGWTRRGHDLGFGVGVAQGFATLGRIGFEGRSDYAAIGSVTNLAARLCAAAGPGQVLVSERVFAAVEERVAGHPVGASTCAVQPTREHLRDRESPR